MGAGQLGQAVAQGLEMPVHTVETAVGLRNRGHPLVTTMARILVVPTSITGTELVLMVEQQGQVVQQVQESKDSHQLLKIDLAITNHPAPLLDKHQTQDNLQVLQIKEYPQVAKDNQFIREIHLIITIIEVEAITTELLVLIITIAIKLD